VSLDETDLEIIGHLQEDGRRSFRAIADDLGLSEGAVRQRVTRMRENSVLHVSAIVDPTVLGERIVATVLVAVQGDVALVAQALGELPEVEYVVVTIGPFDVLAELVCDDTEHLLQIVNERIRQVAGVLHVQTLLQVHVHKQVYEWVRHSRENADA
jgi:Lrp/AsnC family transcriptional regulator for asnA, asnC and gidA